MRDVSLGNAILSLPALDMDSFWCCGRSSAPPTRYSDYYRWARLNRESYHCQLSSSRVRSDSPSFVPCLVVHYITHVVLEAIRVLEIDDCTFEEVNSVSEPSQALIALGTY